jgi:hypothetical protein
VQLQGAMHPATIDQHPASVFQYTATYHQTGFGILRRAGSPRPCFPTMAGMQPRPRARNAALLWVPLI